MRSGNWKIVPALSALVLATMFAPAAHAGCGLYSPVPHAASCSPDRVAATCTGGFRRRGCRPARTHHRRNLERALDLRRQ